MVGPINQPTIQYKSMQKSNLSLIPTTHTPQMPSVEFDNQAAKAMRKQNNLAKIKRTNRDLIQKSEIKANGVNFK